jgi:very-short-patch-repair endonuclease
MIPRELSEGEETFELHCRTQLSATWQPGREFVFDPPRKWRFDFAWPDIKIAVEIEGATEFGKSRHSRGAGFEQDASKYNRAAELYWRVFRFSTAMVKSGEAIDTMKRVLGG